MRRLSPAGLGLVALVIGIATIGLATYALHDYRFPIGADAPVYVWWARLAEHDGLSAVRGRPGIPALTLLLGGLNGASEGNVAAALEVVLTCGAATAALALVTLGGSTRRPVAAGARWYSAALVGAYSVHLAVGYIATLALAVCLLAALALLFCRTRVATAGATAVLAAGVLAHPTLAPLAIGVLGVMAAMAWLARSTTGPSIAFRDTEHGRIVIATGGALVASGVALAALLAGIGPLPVDTSRDDFLARSGLGSMLPSLFRSRLLEHAGRYAPFVALPLAILGALSTDGPLARCLRAWAIVLAVGVGVGYVTGAFPAERVVSFAFVIPLAAGIGVAVVAARIRARAHVSGRIRWSPLGPVVVAGALAAMVFPAARLWLTTPPQLFPLEVIRVRQAVASLDVPPGTSLVVIVSGRQPIASFFATEAGNAIRASVPPERIRDVRILVPGGVERLSSFENDRLVEQTWEDAAVTGDEVVLDLAPFDRAGFGRTRAPGALPPGLPVTRPMAKGIAVAQPSTSGIQPASVRPNADPWPGAGSFLGLVITVLVVIAALSTAGVGWARWWVGPGRPLEAAALAPAAGVAAMILLGIAVDRIGLPLGDAAVSWVTWAGSTASGAAIAWRFSSAGTRGVDLEPGSSPAGRGWGPSCASAERIAREGD